MQRRPGNDEASKARLFGKRAALIGCGAVAAWFMFASLSQIIPGVFGAGIVPLSAGEPGSPERACAESLKRAAALDPSAGPAEGPRAEDLGLVSCSESQAGLDALAALDRLRMAQGQLGRRDQAAVATLRQELSAHLPVEMR